MILPSICWRDAVGVHRNALILRANDSLYLYIPGAFVDRDLGHRLRHMCQIDRAGEADAAAARRGRRLPAELRPPPAPRAASAHRSGGRGGTQEDRGRNLLAMVSMCDSRAKVLVLTEGARQGPTAKGCSPAGLPASPSARRLRALMRDVIELPGLAFARAVHAVIPEAEVSRRHPVLSESSQRRPAGTYRRKIPRRGPTPPAPACP